jgi:hypothetical protein
MGGKLSDNYLDLQKMSSGQHEALRLWDDGGNGGRRAALDGWGETTRTRGLCENMGYFYGNNQIERSKLSFNRDSN